MKERDIKVSNIKGLLIFLVVFGHLIESSKLNNYELFNFIYAFHMPLFIFISGYLAKRVRFSKIINLILLYLIFQAIFNVFMYLVGIYESIHFGYETPQFHLWYIVSLIVWYIVSLLLLKLNLNKAMKWIIFIAILAISFISRWYAAEILTLVRNSVYENFDTYTLSFQRTITFAPFFFAGFFMNRDWFSKLSELFRSKSLNILLSIAIVTVFFIVIERINRIENAFRGSFGAVMFLDDLTVKNYILVVITHYIIATILCLLVVNLVSGNEMILSRWGDMSLTIFLFHPMFVFVLQRFQVLEDLNSNTQIVFCTLVSTIICYVLSSKLFTKYTKPLCQPYVYLKKAFRKQRLNEQ